MKILDGEIHTLHVLHLVATCGLFILAAVGLYYTFNKPSASNE